MSWQGGEVIAAGVQSLVMALEHGVREEEEKKKRRREKIMNTTRRVLSTSVVYRASP